MLVVPDYRSEVPLVHMKVLPSNQSHKNIHIYSYIVASGAESHYEICCSFPQNVRTVHALLLLAIMHDEKKPNILTSKL